MIVVRSPSLPRLPVHHNSSLSNVRNNSKNQFLQSPIIMKKTPASPAASKPPARSRSMNGLHTISSSKLAGNSRGRSDHSPPRSRLLKSRTGSE